MANVRTKETTYTNPKKVLLKFPDHYVNTTCVLAASAAVDDADGKKYFPAGMCIKALLTSPAPCAASTDKFDAVVFNDEYVPNGATDVTVTVLIHGFVRSAALVQVDTPLATPASNTDMIVVL